MAPPPGAPVPPFRKPAGEGGRKPADTGSWIGCGITLAILAAVGGSSQCSQRPAGNSAAFVDANVSSAIAAQPAPPVQPLSEAAVDRGMGHLRIAVSAEGFSGAMIYSQNCYDRLAHGFTWARLDGCGGFDMLASRSIPEADMTGLDNEAGYFQSEAAAGRYLAAATAAGQQVADADNRLSSLQARASRARLVGRRPAPAPVANQAVMSENLLDAPLEDDVENVAGE